MNLCDYNSNKLFSILIFDLTYCRQTDSMRHEVIFGFETNMFS